MKQTNIIRFAGTGSLMEYSHTMSTSAPVKRTWKRGEISAFSYRSRSRLNRKISMLTRNTLPMFVTLTYHLDIPEDFQGYKNHLDNFFIALIRKFPKAGAIWKLEYQMRGYAHFHLFVWGVPLDDLRAFVPGVWHRIAGYGSEDHLKWHNGELNNEHCVQAIRTWNGVKSYASKYLAKIEDSKVGGLVWGIRGNVPFSKILEFRCSLAVALKFREAVARKLNIEFRHLGFWCGNYDVDWLLFLDDLSKEEFVLNNPPDEPPEWEEEVEQPEEGFFYDSVIG